MNDYSTEVSNSAELCGKNMPVGWPHLCL